VVVAVVWRGSVVQHWMEFAHFEATGVDGRSFFSGAGGLQMELDFLFIVKRGDVDSLQSPAIALVMGRL